MSDKVAIRFQPQRAEIAVERGQSILDAALSGKLSLPHKCGGHGTCGTCKVQIESKTELPCPTKLELRHLTETRIESGYRLACQCKLTGPATVTIPEHPLRRVVRELLAAQRLEKSHESAVNVQETTESPTDAATPQLSAGGLADTGGVRR